MADAAYCVFVTGIALPCRGSHAFASLYLPLRDAPGELAARVPKYFTQATQRTLWSRRFA
jgi:hypothetical protein